MRSSRPDANASAADARSEATRILMRSLASGELAADDRTYLAQLIAARTGISQEDAGKRLDQTTAQIKAADAKARQVADAARKAAAMASLYTALSLLIGAFIASVAAVAIWLEAFNWIAELPLAPPVAPIVTVPVVGMAITPVLFRIKVPVLTVVAPASIDSATGA